MLVSRFPYQKLTRKTIDGQRLYSCPDGSKLPSVTTILAATKSKESKAALSNWKNRVGHAKAANITLEAGSRGTRMHSFIENYMHNDFIGESGTNPFSIESHKMAAHIIKNGLKDVTEFYASEASLYYAQLYAGATDTVFLENGQIVLGDFKQSNRVKLDDWVTDYKIQISAYIEAHNHQFGTSIAKGKIMMCTPKLEYQEWILEGVELEKYKELWWKKLEQYYMKKFGVGDE